MVLQVSGCSMTIKWKLNQLMFERGIKSGDLVKATGFHPNTISKLKNLREMPDRLEKATLDGLCKALGVQPGELLSYEPEVAIIEGGWNDGESDSDWSDRVEHGEYDPITDEVHPGSQPES